MAFEAGKCPNCGNYDTLVPFKADRRHVTWHEHNGEVIEVAQYRCVACAAGDLMRRDWFAKHEKDPTIPGQAMAKDGRFFIPRRIFPD